MPLTINDLYECETYELEQHITNPQITTQTLESYVKEVLKLLEEQKLKDKAAEIMTSPRPKNKSRRAKSDPLDNIDTISISSSTTSSRVGRRTRSRKPISDTLSISNHTSSRRTNHRKTTRSNGMDGDASDEDDELDIDEFATSNQVKHNSVDYEWLSGVNDDPSDSSSPDPLLDFDVANLNEDTFNDLLNDKTSKHSKKSTKKKKKKHKSKDKKKKKKKHKKKKKRKDKNESDEEFMITSEDEDDEWDAKHYEMDIALWSLSKLEKEERSLEGQIEAELKRSLKRNERARSRFSESDTEQDLNKLSLDELQAKLRSKCREIDEPTQPQHEDPSKLYCVCRGPYDGITDMICCDYCSEWYHLECIGLSAHKLAEAKNLKFKCPVCNGADPNDITNKSSFDSPKSTPNAQLVGPHSEMVQKLEQLIVQLQNRLKENKLALQKQKKEMNERLSKAKHDIDEERRQRIAVDKHMEEAKKTSNTIIKELGENCKHQKDKETELVNKLKKLEANKKKYKDSASENKKKMKQLKEEHENRIHELEDELIPTLNAKLAALKEKYNALLQQLKEVQLQQISQQQAAQNRVTSVYNEYHKLQQQMNGKLAELAKIQNLNSQLKHKMDTLHVQAQNNHDQWENISQVKDAKIDKLHKQIESLQAHHLNNNNMAQTSISSNTTGNNTPRPPSPIKMPQTPNYLKFNDLELEELKMCKDLCQKLLEARLFPAELMAERASLAKGLFLSWVMGTGQSPTVINDLNQQNVASSTELNSGQHLSMNRIRLLLINIRQELEQIRNTETNDNDRVNKAAMLLNEFQAASQAYEVKMNEFNSLRHERLLEACRTQGNVLEHLCVVDSDTNSDGQAPRSEWVQVTVCSLEAANNRVLVRNARDKTMSYCAIDSATLRLPENLQNNSSNNNILNSLNGANLSTNTGNHLSVMTANSNIPPQSYWNRTQSVRTPNPSAMSMVSNMSFNTAQMNFNGIPAIPTFPAPNTILPPFNDLQANNIGNQHHISNTINTNNNISINGGSTHDPIVIADEEDTVSRKSNSRKRKRDERTTSKTHKKKKKSKHKGDDGVESSDSDDSSSSSDESDVSSDSETESESQSQSRKSRKKKKKTKKHKKIKKSKKTSKKSKKTKDKKSNKDTKKRSKRGRTATKKNGHEDGSRSVSISVSASPSSRKRRGTKRQLSNSVKLNGTQIPSKRRRIDALTTDPKDKNDSECRICKHKGELVCCEGCPSAYHADCIRPRVKQDWLDKFEEWFCPSCAPRMTRIPLKHRQSGEKWPQNKEPLLMDLGHFLKKHPFLERDWDPEFHPSRKVDTIVKK